MALGLTWALALLGAIRELIGTGALFSGIEMIVPSGHAIQILPADYPGSSSPYCRPVLSSFWVC